MRVPRDTRAPNTEVTRAPRIVQVPSLTQDWPARRSRGAAELLSPHRRSGDCGAPPPSGRRRVGHRDLERDGGDDGQRRRGEPDELQLLRVRAPRHVQRRRCHHRRVRAVQVGRRSAEGCVARGRRSGRGAPDSQQLLPTTNTANVNAQLARLPCERPKPSGQGERPCVRGRSGQPHHRPPDERWPRCDRDRSDEGHGARAVATDSTGFRSSSPPRGWVASPRSP